MVDISFDFIDVEIDGFDEKGFNAWIKKVLSVHEVKEATLAYYFVSDSYLLELNRKHLDHDFFTDIITFNYNEENSLSGEMFISVDRVRENAVDFSGGDFNLELSRVIIHGVLHLLGFDDQSESEKLKIREQEDICLRLK